MPAKPKITVAVVEDDARVRQHMASILKRAPDVTCLGIFSNAEDAVREIPQLQPSVLFMDINLPDRDGVWAVQQLAPLALKTQIVMLTVHDDTDTIFNSLAAGASGYLLKPVQSAELLSAARTVSSGGVPMTSNIARKIIQSFGNAPAPTSTAAVSDEMASLTAREREVLECLAKGYLYKEVAELLSISYRTVHTHIEHIYEKLHVRSRTQAVAMFFDQRHS